MWAPDAREVLGAATPEKGRQPDRRANLVLSPTSNVLNELDVAETGLDIRKPNSVAIEIVMKNDESNVMGCDRGESQLETNGFSSVIFLLFVIREFGNFTSPKARICRSYEMKV